MTRLMKWEYRKYTEYRKKIYREELQNKAYLKIASSIPLLIKYSE